MAAPHRKATGRRPETTRGATHGHRGQHAGTVAASAAAAVPIRLADPGVAELLRSGNRVDVVALDQRRGQDTVLATDAVVITVRPAGSSPGDRGRLVVVALPRNAATRVAAASLGQPVT